MDMEFKKVPNQYRPIPFWSWNEKLEPEETAAQVREMNRVGIGGFFMHARGGLSTEYMGKEWFENVDAAVAAAEESDMGAWAYDENGWPSGMGNGAVCEMGLEYQQKYLRMSKDEPAEHVICKSGAHWFYYDVNQFYVDTLNKKATEKFIEEAYEPYYQKYGNRLEGFFTDEPQISRNGIPWSFVLEEEYQKRYRDSLKEHLEELFLETGDYKNTRVKFWKMVTDLFSASFMKPIYDWCSERDLKLTGHLVLEESLDSQPVSNGACMPHYEYFHVPGMDWLGRNILDCLTPMQLSSVCEQLGRPQVISETFALCGHNVSFAELKGIYEWQMVHGINLLYQHLEGYSIRGIRKRDYPPAMYLQQPWWEEYQGFVDAMAREGMILTNSEKKAEVLVLHPQTTAWAMYDDDKNAGIEELNAKLLSVMKKLEAKHIAYHLGDEIIMERHGHAENGRLVIGRQSYRYLIDPGCEILLDSTKKLLEEFAACGGQFVTADELPANDVIDNPEITYKSAEYDGHAVHFFTNTSDRRKTATVSVRGKRLDIYSGELLDFSGEHEFEPWGSLMLIEDGSENAEGGSSEKTYIHPEKKLRIAEPVCNALTLDRCDYSFDGVLQERNGYVLNICERANALERPVKIHQDYHVVMNALPEELYLVCETPEKFEITVNGQPIDKTDCGYFADKSFRKIKIASYVQKGVNTISFDCNFVQSEEFYRHRRNSFLFEGEKNRLVYDMEIEAIYLLGDFCVKTDGKWTQLDRSAVRYAGGFELDAPKETVCAENLEQQGYPFFCGKMCLEGEINIMGENPVLKLNRKGVNAVKVQIGDKEEVLLTDDELPLAPFGVSGKTKVRLTLVNNLRNLLGPHHLKIGEEYAVGPHSFFKEPCVWNFHPESAWDDDYCFVETGI